jgi:hypothetical protein
MRSGLLSLLVSACKTLSFVLEPGVYAPKCETVIGETVELRNSGYSVDGSEIPCPAWKIPTV